MAKRERVRARSYCFTWNNPTIYNIEDMLRNVTRAKYWCFGFETAKTGTEHLQGYVQWNNPMDFNTTKMIFYDAHIEIAKGTPAQNIEYCSKEGDFYEFGERPSVNGATKKKTWEELQEIMQNPKDNISMYGHYKKTHSAIVQEEIKTRESETKFYCITPIEDVITEVHDYFDTIPDLAIVEDINELADYPDDPQNVLLLEDNGTNTSVRTLNLYPRGRPMTYKYGYEVRHIKPQRFIIETRSPGLYPLYKNIN